MQSVTIGNNQAGQRLDKFLRKYLPEAGSSFLYKMLRKKNITLNGKKADGSEKVVLGDEVKIFLSDETFEKFTTEKTELKQELKKMQSQINKTIPILYEDENVLILNKPAGLLSQKAKVDDVSIIEHILSYLMESKKVSEEELNTFKPGVCNRLDRNTSGVIVAGKSLAGLQEMSELFKDRSLHKYYRCIVKGTINESKCIKGYLKKDEAMNKVKIYEHAVEDSDYIETEYTPIKKTDRYTLLEVKLITGKTHQIRAHLNSIGHSIIGDTKYGSDATNQYFKKNYGLKYQLLHAYRLEFPTMTKECEKLSNQVIVAPLNEMFQKIEADLFQ